MEDNAVMFGSLDQRPYSRGDGALPAPFRHLKIVTGLSEHDMRQYLGERAVRAYAMRKSNYAELIERIAPTAGELGLIDSTPREWVGV